MVDVSDNEEVVNGEFVSPRDLVGYYPRDQKPLRGIPQTAGGCFEPFCRYELKEQYPYFDCNEHLTIGCGTLLCLNNGKIQLWKDDTNKNDEIDDSIDKFNLCKFTNEQKEIAVEATKMVKDGDFDKITQDAGRCKVSIFKDTEGRHHVITKKENGEEIHCTVSRGRQTKFEGDYSIDGDMYTLDVERIPNAGVRLYAVSKNNNSPIHMPCLNENQIRTAFVETFDDFYYQAHKMNCFGDLPRDLQVLMLHHIYVKGSIPSEWRNIKTVDEAVEACRVAIEGRGNTPELEDFRGISGIVASTIDNYDNKRVIDKDNEMYAQFSVPLIDDTKQGKENNDKHEYALNDNATKPVPDKVLGHGNINKNANDRDQLATDMKQQNWFILNNQNNSYGLNNQDIHHTGYAGSTDGGYRNLEIKETSLYDLISPFEPEARVSVSNEMKSDAENSANGLFSYVSDKALEGWAFVIDGYNRLCQRVDERCGETELPQNAGSNLAKIGGMAAILNSRGGRC